MGIQEVSYKREEGREREGQREEVEDREKGGGGGGGGGGVDEGRRERGRRGESG